MDGRGTDYTTWEEIDRWAADPERVQEPAWDSLQQCEEGYRRMESKRNREEQLQWERLHHLEIWTWEEELDGKGPWAQPGEYRRPKEEIEAAKAERHKYEEAARATRLETGKSPQKIYWGGAKRENSYAR